MTALGLNEQPFQKMKSQPGFVVTLDHSGDSTPKALDTYGIKEGSWSSDNEMFEIVHQMGRRQ
jgi:fructose-bisphosphate aldolase class I